MFDLYDKYIVRKLFNIDKIKNYSLNNHDPENNKNDLQMNRLKIFLQKLSLKPVDIFVKLDLETTRIQMKKTFINKSGIYMIVNIINNKFYIGSAIKNRLYIRYNNHLILYLGSKIVAKAVQKYGLKNFAFLILEYCDSNIIKNDRKFLLNKETVYIRKYNPPYNVLKVAGSSLGYKHSVATIEKMKKNYSQERKNMIGSLNKGKVLSDEIREKLRLIAYNRPKMSLITREKCGFSNNKPVVAYNTGNNTFRKDSSMRKLAIFLKVCPKTVKRAIISGKLIKNKWLVKFDNST
jgi:group I intron endonuclease